MVATFTTGSHLSDIQPGETGIIAHFTDPYVAGKLMAMGILPGTRVKMIRKAPLGGGFYIKADDNLIALRKKEAACVVVR